MGAVTSPPYDVMDRPMIEELLERHPRNVVRLVLPRLVADPMRTDDPDEHAAKQLQRWIDSGVLRPDPDPALYVYDYRVGGHQVQGLIGALALRKRTESIILPHENVVPDIVADRLAMMSAAAANLEPILLVYDGAGRTAEILAEATSADPLVDFEGTGGATNGAATEGGRHRLWAITDRATVAGLQERIAPHQALIADGHHRYATYLELRRRYRQAGCGPGPWDFGLALLIDSSQYPLQLGAIHRTLSDVSLERLTAPERYDLSPPYPFDLTGNPSSAREFVLTDGTSARTLTSHVPPASAVTDAELLHSEVIAAWHASADQLGFHHTVEQAIRSARLDGGVAIVLHPAQLEQVMEVARSGSMLPRKSTSFGPKPRTGLVMRRFVDA